MDSAAADLTSGVGSFSNIIRAGIYTNNGCQINSITQSRVNQWACTILFVYRNI